MPYKKLYLLVEGDDDERFAERVIMPRLRARYDHIQVWTYAQKKSEKVNSFLRTIQAMGAEYYLLSDIDANACLGKKRAALLQEFPALRGRQAVILVKEIESWYMAGLTDRNPLRLRVPRTTCTLTKEQFNDAMPKRFDSRVDYMSEVLKHFDARTAARRNDSFRYFMRRCGLAQR